eukprot:2239325-Karenia_brevis.AAC.1
MQVLFADSIPDLLSRRLPVLCPMEFLPEDWDPQALQEEFRKLPPYIVFVILRTWANGWTTSRRMHEPLPLQCVFGCPGASDEL